MKKIGDLMKEMGFRKDASDSVKEAFIKHLIKNATGTVIETPNERKQKLTLNKKSFEQKADFATNSSTKKAQTNQLSFEFYQDLSRKKDKAS